MKNFNYIFLALFLLGTSGFAQQSKQRKADRLYKEMAYYEATDVYKELLEKNYNELENSLKLGDAYMKLRSPENAVHYYGDVIEDPNISPEYYYKYAQALRAVKRYDESRQWLKRYLESKGRPASELDELAGKTTAEIEDIYKLNQAHFNSEMSDFGVFEQNGKIYFVSARVQRIAKKDRIYSWNGEPFLDIYVIDENGNTSALPGEVNSKLHDGPLVISKDGNSMYFTRNNILNDKLGKRDKNAINHLKIYKATRNGQSWGNVIELPINSDTYSVGHPALSADGKYLYFTSDMPGGMGGTDIYRVEIRENDAFGPAENLGEKVNTSEDESFPFVMENQLYFSSTGHGGLGLADIFRIDLSNAEASAENLGEPVNSSMDDFAYFQLGDSKTGYISSNRSGNDNIYAFNHLGPLMLRGKVSDAVNGEPIASATIRLLDENGNQSAFLETDSEGNYSTIVARDREIPMEVRQIEYQDFDTSLSTSGKDEQEEMEYNIQLQPVQDVEYLAEIDNIYFDFDKSNIRPDAAKELDKLVELMQNKYPELVIEIGSHTDRRGSEAYNEGLSQRRAKATRDYLISKGIAEERIHEFKGYGESQPAIDCDRCTEKDHQLNRRSMFKVVEMN